MDKKKHVDDPAPVPDKFVTSFEIEDFEDWLRLTCWTEHASNRTHGGELRKTASLIIPRTSLYELLQSIRISSGPYREPERAH